ncbi:MAG: hypothetical protein VZR95_01775 [Alphaproteobacteria bacterium]
MKSVKNSKTASAKKSDNTLTKKTKTSAKANSARKATSAEPVKQVQVEVSDTNESCSLGCFKNIQAKDVYAFLSENTVWLSIWLIFGAVMCMLTQFDFLWDYENYHLYNPWYWFDSKGYDVYTPLGTINSFLNPLPDTPLYFLIKWFNNYTILIYAFQGLWFGGLIFCFHKVALLYFDKEGYRNIALFILTMAIAITGQATWFQAGTSTNETQIAFFAMWGIYLVLRQERHPELRSAMNYFWAGLIFGIGLGLKQTSLTYAFAIGFTMIIFYKNYTNPIKFIGMFILGGFIGVMSVYGFVLYRNYVDYGNPVMPFLNTWFKSEYYDDLNFQDRRHIPVSFWEFLYYPYIWETRAAEIYYQDCRGWVFYTLAWVFGLYAIGYYIIKHKRVEFFDSHLNRFTTVFMFISYIIWTLFFSIFRYLIPMEMLFAVFLVKAMDKLLFTKYRQWLVILQIVAAQVLLFEFLSVPTHHSWGRLQYLRQDKFVDMEKIILPPNTLVKFYNLPIGFIAPLLARDNPYFKAVAYIDPAFGMNTDFTERNKFAEIRNKVVSEHKGPIVYFAVGDITAEIIEKNEIVHSPDFKHYSELEKVDRRRTVSRARHFQHVVDNYTAGHHRMTVALEDAKELAKIDFSPKSYKINNEEISKMYCRKLKINANNKRYVVCVPEELKYQILKEQASIVGY